MRLVRYKLPLKVEDAATIIPLFAFRKPNGVEVDTPHDVGVNGYAEPPVPQPVQLPTVRLVIVPVVAKKLEKYGEEVASSLLVPDVEVETT